MITQNSNAHSNECAQLLTILPTSMFILEFNYAFTMRQYKETFFKCSGLFWAIALYVKMTFTLSLYNFDYTYQFISKKTAWLCVIQCKNLGCVHVHW